MNLHACAAGVPAEPDQVPGGALPLHRLLKEQPDLSHHRPRGLSRVTDDQMERTRGGEGRARPVIAGGFPQLPA
jgi:hypothetical protein